ncbi:MAG: flagellar hook-associated protein FlgK [Bacteroides sp.]|nr:flagellar hook-associated protein FlgK [Prevotella sp.]MCM1407362.1 flagellar hook-associated protein FlgK [Treponema brennaborense]MCM1469852.1 flagellar hook-associated protein FlgK [Bacteroides sp.]
MANSFSGIEIGKRSLMAHSQSINTAGHNISNAGTEGYSRQRVEIRAFSPLYRPDLTREETPGQIGQGSAVQSIARVRDELLDSRITAQSNRESYWQTREKYYSMLEKIYNEPADVSVRSTMDAFWESWQELSVYPESKAARSAVIARADTMINAVRQRENALAGIGTQLNGDIEAVVKQVNEYSLQIAEINKEIIKSRAMGDNPNDLLDRRDLMVEKLSSLINITTDQRDSDEFMVHLDGHILVQGGIARGFAVEALTDNNGYSKIVWNDTRSDAFFSGGTLGALVELRDVDVRHELQELNTMTINFADLLNDIHRSAVGMNGVGGLDFFVEQPFVTNAAGNYDRDGDGTADTSYIFRMTGAHTLGLQNQIGLRGSITINGKTDLISVPYFPEDTVEAVINRINDSDGEVKAYLDRSGKLALKATTSFAGENPDFVIRHVEDSGHFLTGYAGLLRGSGAEGAYDFARADAVDVLRTAGGEDASFADYAVAPVLNPSAYMEVNPAVKSDVLSVAAGFPEDSGYAASGDGSAALEIASLRNTQVMIGRARTFDDYFAESVTEVGLKGEQAQINSESQHTIMEDLRSLRDSISGVNIDEELADIIKFQHGYNAAAKFITVIDELLDTVINRLGV